MHKAYGNWKGVNHLVAEWISSMADLGWQKTPQAMRIIRCPLNVPGETPRKDWEGRTHRI